MPDIKLISLDLDGTLLNSRKELTEENFAALQWAAEQGIEIVPTTGRFFGGMPESIRSLPFLHYAITINGAQVFDVRREEVISSVDLPAEQAVALMEYLDEFPVIYDCDQDNWGWMSRAFREQVPNYAPDEHCMKMLLDLRSPVDDLKQTLRERGRGVQKVQLFANDLDLRDRLMAEIPQRFPELIASSSLANNVEINHKDAHKGVAIQRLAKHLGIDVSQTMAFGDGLNDLTMLETAGIGVCMANGRDTVKAVADYVTTSCDESGVAKGIYHFCK